MLYMWSSGHDSERAALASHLREVLALASSACSIVGSGVQVVQAKRSIANTMGLPLDALARAGQPLGCLDRYFEPCVTDPPFRIQLGLNKVRKELH